MQSSWNKTGKTGLSLSLQPENSSSAPLFSNREQKTADSTNAKAEISNTSTPSAVKKGSQSKSKNGRKRLLFLAGLLSCFTICSIPWTFRPKHKVSIKPIAVNNISVPERVVPQHVTSPVVTRTSPPIVFKKNEEPAEKIVEKRTRTNWARLVSVATNNYSNGFLGGIKNLSVEFVNKSNYQLDEVVAKIVYLKSNGKPLKSRLVSVFNVLPHSKVTQVVTNVGRGKSVTIDVYRIVSSRVHFLYEEGRSTSSRNDYYSK